MVAKFLNDSTPKTSLQKKIRTVSNFIDCQIQFHLICQMLVKFSGVESERTLSKVRDRQRKYVPVFFFFTFSIKRVLEIRKFHVAET